MKINEFSNIDLNEFNPFSKKSRQMRKANLAGKRNLQMTTDNLERQFATYLGGKGKKIKQADYNDVAAFLNSKNVDTSDIDQSLPINPKRLTQIFSAKAKQAISGEIKTLDKAKQEPEAKPSSAYAQTKSSAMKLNAKEKRRLIQQLEKSIKTKSAPTVVDKNFDKSQKLSSYGKVGK